MYLVSQQLWDNLHLDNGKGMVNYEARETADMFEIMIEVPGVAKTDIEVLLEKDTLLIHYTRRGQKFNREFYLSEEIDRDNIKANCVDGMLNLQLPKKKREVRKIAVQ